MRSLLKSALVCSYLFLFAAICLADNGPQQASAAVPKLEILRVLVTDCIDKTPVPDPETRQVTTAAIYTAIDRFGISERNRFDRISRQEVWTAAERLGLPVPEEAAPSGQWTEEERFRLGKALHADLVCDAQVMTAVNRKNAQLRSVVVSLNFRDITSRIPLIFRCSTKGGKRLYAATKSCAEEAMRVCAQHAIVSAHVRSRRDQTVDVNLGVRGGVKVGDDCVIVREIAGKKVQIGMIKIVRSHPTDAEGLITASTGEIQAGDIALVAYSQACDGLLSTSRK